MSGVWTRRKFVTGLTVVGGARVLPAWGQTSRRSDDALHELMAGNERFIAGKLSSFPEDLRILKEKTVSKQEPFAAVLSCADSRVPVEIIFDQSIGHLFVARVAGNVVTPEIIGSLEYGVAVLGVKAIMVLGHSNCGAINAAVNAKEVPGQISVLYQHLMPGVREVHGGMNAAVRANVVFQTRLLGESSTVIAKAIKSDGLRVVGGVYDLSTGRVTLLS